jgi:hypothetical protein
MHTVEKQKKKKIKTKTPPKLTKIAAPIAS